MSNLLVTLTYLKIQTNCPSRYSTTQLYQNTCQHYCHLDFPLRGNATLYWIRSRLQLPQCCQFVSWNHLRFLQMKLIMYEICFFSLSMSSQLFPGAPTSDETEWYCGKGFGESTLSQSVDLTKNCALLSMLEAEFSHLLNQRYFWHSSSFIILSSSCKSVQ